MAYTEYQANHATLTHPHDLSGFPIMAVPQPIQRAILDVWEKTRAPLPLVATSAFSALSIACQHLFDVQRPVGKPGPCNLFFLTIADSGERKTSCDRYFTQPIQNFEQRHAEENQAAHQAYTTALDVWCAKEQGLKRKIQRLSSKDEPTAEAEQQLRQHHEHPPARPASMRLLFDDVSPTAILSSLHDHWPSVGILSDEAGKLFNGRTFENIGLFNKLWDGDPISLDRHRTSGSYTVRGARLTMSLMSQRKTLKDFLDKQGSLARDNGFLARCLTCCPLSTQGSRFIGPKTIPHWTEKSTATEPLEDFHRVIERLLRSAWHRHQHQKGRITVRMNGSADGQWRIHHDEIERGILPPGQWCEIKDSAAKSAEIIARLACLFAAFESADQPESTEIGPDHIERAARICYWYMHHFREIFGDISMLTDGYKNSEKLLAWLHNHWQTHQVWTVQKSFIIKYGPSGVRNSKALNEALAMLSGRNLLKIFDQRSSEGRPLPTEVGHPSYIPAPQPGVPVPYQQNAQPYPPDPTQAYGMSVDLMNPGAGYPRR